MIDQQSLRNLSTAVCGEEDLEFLREIVDLFHTQTPLQLQKIVRGIEKGDFEEVSKAAHMLKSSCSTLGADDMATDCRELEMIHKENREIARDRAVVLLHHLQKCYEQSSQELQMILRDLSGSVSH